MRIYSQLSLTLVILFLAACRAQTQPLSTEPILETPAATEAAAIKQVKTPTAEIVPTATSRIPVDKLKNAAYSGIFDEPLRLVDGMFEKSFEGQPYTVQYDEGAELFADLDGDGVEDAIVFLIERGGGTAVFTYVAAQLNRNGSPVDAGAAMVEDRTQVRLATIQDGQVVLDITTRGPGDVDCCPSHKTRKVFTLEGDRLTEVPAEDQELVKISADDLDGTSWTLLEMNYDQPALVDSEVTISFHEDQISGSGGCNSYTSSFSLGEGNPFIFTTGPIVATQKACPDPILDQENAYFKILDKASLWGYDHGCLVLFYLDDQGEYSRLLFAPQEMAAGCAGSAH